MPAAGAAVEIYGLQDPAFLKFNGTLGRVLGYK